MLTGGRVENFLTKEVIAHVLSSYAKRELDRKWLDEFMRTSFGQKFKRLTYSQKLSLEFLTYIAVGFLTQTRSEKPAFRIFLDQVVADLPSEIMKRSLHGSTLPSSADLKSAIESMTESELDALASAVERAKQEPEMGQASSSGRSGVGRLADRINQVKENLEGRPTA